MRSENMMWCTEYKVSMNIKTIWATTWYAEIKGSWFNSSVKLLLRKTHNPHLAWLSYRVNISEIALINYDACEQMP